MKTRTVGHRGFTLAEVLVASTITGFIALVAVSALKTVTDSSQVVSEAAETTAQVRFVAQMIARDLANLYRDPDRRSMKLVGSSEESAEGGAGTLTFYMVGRAKARAAQPEGDIYEVQYLLAKSTEDSGPAGGPETFTLWRRLWPNPDKQRNPGGVLTPVAQDLSVFHMRFFDGQQWAGEWPEEMESTPQLIEITLAAVPKGARQPVIETFTVSFPRLAARTGGEGGPGPEAQESGEGARPQGGRGDQATSEPGEGR